jgi:hypothetical protein
MDGTSSVKHKTMPAKSICDIEVEWAANQIPTTLHWTLPEQ